MVDLDLVVADVRVLAAVRRFALEAIEQARLLRTTAGPTQKLI